MTQRGLNEPINAPPRTELEVRLCEIWSEVLRRPVDDVKVAFTRLGGNSIGAARVAARIRARLGLRVDLATVLRNGSIEELASILAQVDQPKTDHPDAPLTPNPSRERLPMSHFQEWRFRADDGLRVPLYNMALAYELSGPVRVDVLREVVTELASRHEPLRTNYDIVDGEARQIIHPPSGVDFPVLDTRDSSSDPRADALRLMEAEAMRIVDRRRDNLFQPMLARYADDRYLLMLRIDRIAADGTSFGLIEQDVSDLYASAISGSSPPDPAPLQQADWARWQRELLSGAYLDRLVAYWRRNLDGSQPLIELTLPNGRSQPGQPRYQGRSQHRRLGVELSGQMRARAKEADVTLFIWALSALHTFIWRLSGRDATTVVCPFANRTRPEFERVVGSFAHGLIYRVEHSGDPKFSEMVVRVRDVCYSAWEHQALPTGEVAKHVRPSSYLTLLDEFHVFFDLVRDVAHLKLSEVDVQQTFVNTGASHPSLAVFLDDSTDDFALIVRAAADRIEASALQWIVDEFTALLARTVHDPAECVSGLPPSTESVAHCFQGSDEEPAMAQVPMRKVS